MAVDFNELDKDGRLINRTLTLGEFRALTAAEPDDMPMVCGYIGGGWIVGVQIGASRVIQGGPEVRAIVIERDP